jgi:hypothetical protein
MHAIVYHTDTHAYVQCTTGQGQIHACMDVLRRRCEIGMEVSETSKVLSMYIYVYMFRYLLYIYIMYKLH